MKSICIGTLKGGVGKTSMAFNIAGFLAKKRKKVLCIDADPQANLTNNFGISEFINGIDESIMSIADILLNDTILPSDVIIKNPNDIKYIDLLPSVCGLTASEMQLFSLPGREFVLSNYINKYSAIFEKYDYIIIDTNPSMSIVNQNALYFADSVLLVTDMAFNAIKGAILYYNLWVEKACKPLKKENNIKGLVINKFDRRIKLRNDVIELVKNNPLLRELAMETYIPENVKIRECEIANAPISFYDTKCSGYQAYRELMTELQERGIL